LTVAARVTDAMKGSNLTGAPDLVRPLFDDREFRLQHSIE
jgi:hypothetical protein